MQTTNKKIYSSITHIWKRYVFRHHKIKIVIGFDNRIKFYCHSFSFATILTWCSIKKYQSYSLARQSYLLCIVHTRSRSARRASLLSPGIYDATYASNSAKTINKTVCHDFWDTHTPNFMIFGHLCERSRTLVNESASKSKRANEIAERIPFLIISL